MKWMSGQFEFLKILRATLSVVKNSYLKDGFGCGRLMKGCIGINGRNEASVDQIVTIKSDLSDQRSRVEVSPHALT